MSRTQQYWDHSDSVRTLFGLGSLDELHKNVGSDDHVLLVVSKGAASRGLIDKVLQNLPTSDCAVIVGVSSNPELDSLDELIAEYRNTRFDLIVAIGGGSVIDAGKILSVGLMIGMDRPLNSFFRAASSISWESAVPLIAIPTTSGTGAETTPFATFWDMAAKQKFSLQSPLIMPKLAILDPELSVSLPYDVTRNTALDAISHALESLWNKNKTAISESYARQALVLAAEHLQVALREPHNCDARSGILIASHLAGKAIAKTKTAIAHSMSYPITAHFGVPHGLACSFTLKILLRRYRNSAKMREYDERLFAAIDELLTDLDLAKAIQGYVDAQSLMRLKDQMFTPGRADNYSLEFGPDDIDELILSSLS